VVGKHEGQNGDGAVEMDKIEGPAVARTLASCAAELQGVTRGADRSIPPVPEDEHGVGLLFVELDEAREQLDQHVVGALEAVSRHVREVIVGALAADSAVPVMVRVGG
jgi:hypothetical protein